LPEEEFIFYPRISKINIENTDIDYPIESNLWKLPIEKQIKYLISVIRNGESLGKPEPKNYEEWIRWKLGSQICDNYMIPYNAKLWGVEPKEMDIDWLYKIPQVEVEEVLKYSLQRQQDVNKYPAHIGFYYPKKNGFQSIINAIASDINNIKTNFKVVLLNYDINSQTWLINNTYKTKFLINTTPWNDLFTALGEPQQLKNDFGKIKYNNIVVSLYETDFEHNYHWRYIPGIKQTHHREFYISNFAEDSKKNGVYIETQLNRFSLGATFEGKNIYNYTNKASYPIPVIGHSNAISNILEYYKNKNFFGVGRWGQHQYQNMDISIYEALKFVKEFNEI
jgi:protoporphyrinogen oxidase